MRLHLFALASLTTAALVGCAPSGGRAIEGMAQSGTTTVLAIDSAGETFETTPAADGTFRLELMSTDKPVFLFVLDAAGPRAVKFPLTRGGIPDQTRIPNSDSGVTVGVLSSCDCNDDGDEDEEEAGEN